MEKSWYAVYTRPRWEKKVSERLTEKGLSNYCPLNKVVHKWHDRKKVVLEPLFRMYVFVQIELPEQMIVREVEGVLSFVRSEGRPAVIRDVEIEAIRDFLKDHMNVTVENVSVAPNDLVRISSGPFMYQEGRVIEVNKKTVKINLPSLRVALYAEVDKAIVSKL
jgi:transcription antitermination factor NusG